MDYDVFLSLADTYHKCSQTADPTQMQVGESVYDDMGQEYRVLENDPATTNVVLMPADQAQQQVPEGVKTVEETDLGSYTIQPSTEQTMVRRAANELDWEGIQSAAIDVVAYAKRRDLNNFVEALDYLNSLLLDQTEIPEDMDLSSMFERSGKKSGSDILAEFDKEIEMEVEDVDLDNPTPGESGYTRIIKDIKDMVAAETDTVDLMLAIGEKYPRSMGEKALADARAQGIL